MGRQSPFPSTIPTPKWDQSAWYGLVRGNGFGWECPETSKRTPEGAALPRGGKGKAGVGALLPPGLLAWFCGSGSHLEHLPWQKKKSFGTSCRQPRWNVPLFCDGNFWQEIGRIEGEVRLTCSAADRTSFIRHYDTR